MKKAKKRIDPENLETPKSANGLYVCSILIRIVAVICMIQGVLLIFEKSATCFVYFGVAVLVFSGSYILAAISDIVEDVRKMRLRSDRFFDDDEPLQ